jgi:hypothetical protein
LLPKADVADAAQRAEAPASLGAIQESRDALTRGLPHACFPRCQCRRVSVDPYLLRALLWCGLDELPMVSVMAEGNRAYGCRNAQCAYRLMDAATLEDIAWHRFTALNETLAAGIPDSGKHRALRAVLRRVVVTSRAPDVAIEWRD